jgi:pimeloyl-ACP methyl ester carboxylesterase
MRHLFLRAAVAVIGIAAAALGGEPSAQKAPAPKSVKLTGAWLGPLKVGPIELRLVLKISVDDAGKMSAKLDSIDQGAKDIPVDAITLVDGTLTAESKLIKGKFVAKIDAEKQALVGTWTQGPVSLPLTLKKTEGDFQLKRPQEPKPPFPYRTIEVQFDNSTDLVKLAGSLTVPEGAGPFPAVVLITGSGPQDRDEFLLGHRPFLVLADHLTRRGIAVLRYDDRGVGKSTGNFATSTTHEFKRDAAAALAYLRTRAEIDPRRIGLCGHSEGGLIAPMVASETPDVAFIVLMAGSGVTGEEILYRQGALVAGSMGADEAALARILEGQKKLFAEMKQDPQGTHLAETLKELVDGIESEQERKVAEQTLKGQTEAINSPWFRTFLVLDPRIALKQVACPILAINGEKDVQVDPAQNLPEIAAALQAGGNRDVTIRELPGLNHLFQTCQTGAVSEYGQIEETIAPAALDAISDWIVERMSKSRMTHRQMSCCRLRSGG